MSWESDLDRHITGNYGEDQFQELFCPRDGTTIEDMDSYDNEHYKCPTCEKVLHLEDLVTKAEYKMQCRDDEPDDFDERRDADDR